MSYLHSIAIRHCAGIFDSRLQASLVVNNPEDSAQMVAYIEQSARWLGYTLDAKILAQLRTFPAEMLPEIVDPWFKVFAQERVAFKTYEPFYPNFPAQVRESSQFKRYFLAMMHYLTGWRPEQIILEKPAFVPADDGGFTYLRIVQINDLSNWFMQLLSSKVAWSQHQISDMRGFIQEFPGDIEPLFANDFVSRENLASVLGFFLISPRFKKSNLLRKLEIQIKSATDVLRIVGALMTSDSSLSQAIKFKKISRSSRKQLLLWLETVTTPAEHMKLRPEAFKRLGEALHPGEFKNDDKSYRYPKAFAAFTAIRRSQPITTNNSALEQTLIASDFDNALRLASLNPGTLLRRLDHLYRLSKNASQIDDLIAALALCIPKTATGLILQLDAHIAHRARSDAQLVDVQDAFRYRYFLPKSLTTKVAEIPETRPVIPAQIVAKVREICAEELIRRFRLLTPLGGVFLGPELCNLTVPLVVRNATKALRTVSRGSRLPLPKGDFVRLFLFWCNGASRTDIDLSALFLNADFEALGLIAYYQLEQMDCVHSGDIVDAPNGAAEYIDLNIAELLAQNVRYVLTSIQSFTKQSYCDLPECYAGWMVRDNAQGGELFEPSSLANRIDLASNTNAVIPMMLDLHKQEVIWGDLAATSHTNLNNVDQNSSLLKKLARMMVYRSWPQMDRLMSLHVRARGHLVNNPKYADTIISTTDPQLKIGTQQVWIDPMAQKTIQSEWI